MSLRAFDVCLSLLQPADKFQILHADEAGVEEVPKYRGASYIKMEFELKCDRYLASIGHSSSPDCSILTGVTSSNPPSKVILDYAVEAKLSCLVVGVFGAKGPCVKALSGNTAWLVENSPLDTIIVKPTSRTSKPESAKAAAAMPPRTFLVCVDGSSMSQHCFEAAIRYMRLATDTLQVLHVLDKKVPAGHFSPTKLMRRYAEMMEERGIKGDTNIQDLKKGISVATQIAEAAKTFDASFIVIGIDGFTAVQSGKRKKGFVATTVIEDSSSTLIVVKATKKAA